MPAAVCRVGASGRTGCVEAELGEATANAWAHKEGEANDGTEEGEILGALLLRRHVADEGHGNGHAGPHNAGAEASNEEQGVRVAEALYSAACENVVAPLWHAQCCSVCTWKRNPPQLPAKETRIMLRRPNLSLNRPEMGTLRVCARA